MLNFLSFILNHVKYYPYFSHFFLADKVWDNTGKSGREWSMQAGLSRYQRYLYCSSDAKGKIQVEYLSLELTQLDGLKSLHKSLLD